MGAVLISKLLAAVAIAIAVIAQLLMFAAETIGDLSDEWNSDA